MTLIVARSEEEALLGPPLLYFYSYFFAVMGGEPVVSVPASANTGISVPRHMTIQAVRTSRVRKRFICLRSERIFDTFTIVGTIIK